MATQQQIENTTAAVLRSTPEMAAYDLEDGSLWSKCHAYIMGAFPESILSEASWQIAFKDLLNNGKLKKIPGYVPPVTFEQRQLVDGTPSHLARKRYETDPEFREAFDLIANEQKERQDLLNWARDYNAMDPEEAARRIVEEPGFEAAVQKLIDEGLI
jgi:hypothetical protein